MTVELELKAEVLTRISIRVKCSPTWDRRLIPDDTGIIRGLQAFTAANLIYAVQSIEISPDRYVALFEPADAAEVLAWLKEQGMEPV